MTVTWPGVRPGSQAPSDRSGTPSSSTRSLLAISHGTSSPAGQAAVAALVRAVALAHHSPVLEGFVDVQQPDVPAVLENLGAAPAAVIVPLLLSAGFHVHVDLADAAAAANRPPAIARALGPDDRLVDVLQRRLRESGVKRRDSVVLAVAGSSDDRAVADCYEMARRLSHRLKRRITVGFISAQSPPLAEAVASARRAAPRRRVVVSTYLLAPGYFATLARTAGADVTTAPLLTETGNPPSELVEIVRERFAERAGF